MYNFLDLITIDRRVSSIYPELSEDEFKIGSNKVTGQGNLVTDNDDVS